MGQQIMKKMLLSEQFRDAIQHMERQCEKRAEAELKLKAEYQERQAAAEAAFTQTRERAEEELSRDQSAAINKFQENTRSITRQFDFDYDVQCKEYSARRLKANSRFDEAKDKLQAGFDENCWTIETIFEADKRVAKEELVKIQRMVGTSIQKLDTKFKEIVKLAEKWELSDLMEQVPAPAPDTERFSDAGQALRNAVSTEEECLDNLKRFKAPLLLQGYRLVFLFAVLWLVLLIPAAWMEEWYYWVVASFAAVLSIGLVTKYLLTLSLRVHFLRLFQIAQQNSVNGQVLQKRSLDEATAAYHDHMQQAKNKREQALKKANAEFSGSIQEEAGKTEKELDQLGQKYEPQLEKLQKQKTELLKNAEAEYQQTMGDSTDHYDRTLDEAEAQRKQTQAKNKRSFDSAWESLTGHWRSAVARLAVTFGEIRTECDRLFPDWQKLQGNDWPSPEAVPPGMRFGTLRINFEDFPHGIPEDEQLRSLVPPPMILPALLGFPNRGSLLIKASDEGRNQAIRLLQAVMLRCLTSIPPGKVRFTIFDPVGLGENFAGFAHLADYDEKLVTSRIWTEPAHIEQRLADLTEHIENVIQKYLRNQFNTLEEYNAQAGEVAEPYRLLVIANFPVNFTEAAARRLISIAASGARCGIQTLIMVDTKQPLPRNFEMKDLEQSSSILVWKDGAFRWQDPDFGRFSLQLDAPPSPDECTPLLQIVGERAKNSSRVEVPFQVIAPPSEHWWTGDSRRGIRVALGKAGATRKQLLELGEGTSQHLLIAGKTGSGKSTLLHALIVQLALTYSPEEVELYLVDFKKGVEFKTYATHELPHARVVAIESEREFGLSVLQRLDQELRVRGEKFRAAGVQDLPGYRAAVAEPLPRVLLIVDEFQEFFVEDDRTAQESALLLDRLVRQGRAFGIHILLGSQTLGGAYSLARSTIDQMAIRIALQCSETDGHLILSKENSAARLLSRPGEAIYNNANGLMEGNNLFQVVWLSEPKREECLQQIAARAANKYVVPRPQIVFEGSAPAHLASNPHLHEILHGTASPLDGLSYPAWLGDSIAIKDPTAALFRRQSGSNLLLVGQHPEAALSVLTSVILSLGLASATSPNPPLAGNGEEGGSETRFYLLGNYAGDPRSANTFLRLGELFLNGIEIVDWRQLSETFNELSQEVNQRIANRTENRPPIFLCIYGLQHFRELRRPDDDFGFSRREEGKPIPPSRQFTTILREGPLVGVFTLVWCDTLNNLQRTFDRPTLREFEMRVLFQMNANDSSNLIDSPIASRLGLYRALFCSEDQGRTEKFRPYGLPSEEWLAWLKQQLANHPGAIALEKS